MLAIKPFSKILMLAAAGLVTVGTGNATNAFGAETVRQWTLRYSYVQTHIAAMSGCYGTAPYQYDLPSVAEVQAFRQTLNGIAYNFGVAGFAFTRESTPASEPLVVDLATGDVKNIPVILNSTRQGAVFCICDQNYTQADNCSSMEGVPPLGEPFLAEPDAPTAGPGL